MAIKRPRIRLVVDEKKAKRDSAKAKSIAKFWASVKR